MPFPEKDPHPPSDEIETINGIKQLTTKAWNKLIDIISGNDSEKIPQNAISDLVTHLADRIKKSSIVSVFQNLPDNDHVPSEKLLKDSLHTISLTPGPKGADGLPGPAGTKGDDGPHGPQGIKGDAGPQGSSGIKGDKGDKGDTGLAGATGPQGQTGDTGPQGPAGSIGPQGNTGPKGTEGNIGPQGPQGPAGSGSGSGSQGPQGPKGDKGNTGDKGDQGPQGLQGDIGPTGATGPQGVIGPTGITGSQGPKGDTGDKGTKGDTGTKGDEGPHGAQGQKGDTGLQGTKGDEGTQGSIGPTGATGPQGTKGDTGSQGPKGNTGIQGTTGPKGDKGDTGSQGPKGIDGSGSGSGATGPQGPQGPKGEKGDDGATGSQGPHGSIGPKGADGHQGNTGPKGSTGSTGPKGATGNTGSQGPKGDTGPAGPQGRQGIKGDTGADGNDGENPSYNYICDALGHAILQHDTITNKRTVLAGSSSGDVDGSFDVAKFNTPFDIAISENKRFIVICDYGNNKVKILDRKLRQVISVGSGNKSSVNGDKNSASFNRPHGIAFDEKRNCLYITESSKTTIRKISLYDYMVTTVRTDNTAIYGSITYDGTRDQVIACDTFNNQIDIFDIHSSGILNSPTSVGKSGTGLLDGTRTAALLSRPGGLCMSYDGKYLYFANQTIPAIRRVDLETYDVVTLAGDGTRAEKNGIGSNAHFLSPASIAVKHDNTASITDDTSQNVREIDFTTNKVTTTHFDDSGLPHSPTDLEGIVFAGSTRGKRGLAGNAGSTGPQGTKGDEGPQGKDGVSSDLSGYPKLVRTAENIYFCDTDNNKLRKYNINTKQVTTLSGTWNNPVAIKLSPDGTYLIIVDGTQLIIYILSTDTDAVFAGTTTSGDKNGPSLSAQFGTIQDVCWDKTGENLFIADNDNHKIKIINLSSMIVSTFVGSTQGDSIGDASKTKLNNPSGICLSSDGNRLIIADTGNHKIKETVLSTRVTLTLAGTGTKGTLDGFKGVGMLDDPQNITAYHGVLYAVDLNNHTVRQIDEKTGTITTIAGTLRFGDADGIGSKASFNNPLNITNDYNGNVILSDTNNSKIKTLNIATKLSTTIIGNGTSGHNGDKLGLLTAIDRPRGLTPDCIIQYPIHDTVLIPQITTFDEDGIFTPNDKIAYFIVEGCGAGGSGGGRGQSLDTGGGGASGAYFKKIVRSPSGQYQIVIGKGGAEQQGATSDGNDGGDTTFIGSNVNCTAKGGEGGHSGSSWATGGDGNIATGGDVNIDGSGGENGYDAGNATWMLSGKGGESKLGSVGHGLSQKPSQHVHQQPKRGSGGVGANHVNNTNVAGQAGSDGVIIITEYVRMEVV